MRWSKVRSLVVSRFAPGLKGRLDIHSTAYGNCSCGHAWLTFDGKVIANFCTRAKSPSPNGIYSDHLTSYGELSRQDAYEACWSFLHELSIEEALAEPDPLIQSLAVADSRLGKRRLLKLDASSLHPLAQFILEQRVPKSCGVVTA